MNIKPPTTAHYRQPPSVNVRNHRLAASSVLVMGGVKENIDLSFVLHIGRHQRCVLFHLPSTVVDPSHFRSLGLHWPQQLLLPKVEHRTAYTWFNNTQPRFDAHWRYEYAYPYVGHYLYLTLRGALHWHNQLCHRYFLSLTSGTLTPSPAVPTTSTRLTFKSGSKNEIEN